MKKFAGFYYRCSFTVCLWAFLSLIGLMFLSSSAFADQYDFEYTVSDNTVTITKYTGCSTTGPVVIPPTINNMPVVGIGNWAFEYCTVMTSVTIPDSVTSIGNSAFYSCTGLTSVTIPNSVTSIGSGAFVYCTGLTSVTIGNSVTSIGDSAFENCTSLTSVTIPDSVTNIVEGAFGNCTDLISIVVDLRNTVYSSQDGVLYNKAQTVLIEYPGGKPGGFTIPNSVTSIGDLAFAGCIWLTSVTIPNSVSNIGDYAFYNCTHLTSAYIYGDAPSMGSHVFDYCASNFTVCYTAGSTGFSTPRWYGYPATVCEETTSSSTTSVTTTSTPSTTSAPVTTSKSSSSTTSVTTTSTPSTTSAPVTTSKSSSSTTSVTTTSTPSTTSVPVTTSKSSSSTTSVITTSTPSTTSVPVTTSKPSSSTTTTTPANTTTTTPTECKIKSIQPTGIKIGFGLIPRIIKVKLTLNVNLESRGSACADLSIQNAPKGVSIISCDVVGDSIEATIWFWSVKPGTYNINLGPCGSIPFVISRF